MKKLIFLLLILSMSRAIYAQITPSMTIPNPLPEYDGSYENFGRNHLFYPNRGEIRYGNEDQDEATDEVGYYTKFTYPAQFLLNNTNMSFVFTKSDTTGSTPIDSLHRVDLKMDRGNSSAFLARVDTQNTSVLNYFTQWFGSIGLTDVRGGAAIAVQSIYPNIDMVYTSNNAGLKIYYIIYPGGNPNNIIMHFDGAKSTGISGSALVIKSNWDQMSFEEPTMFQYTYTGGIVTPVNVCPATWQSLGSDRYNITTTASWSTSLPLIIEVKQAAAIAISTPGLKWSTYIGGSMQDFIYKSKSDANNNLFVAGKTTSPNFPVNIGPMVVTTVIGTLPVSIQTPDGFIAKFDPSGVLLWVTYVGGAASEIINDFDFKNGDIYCVGATNSQNLPAQPKTAPAMNFNTNGGGFRDGFILQLSSNGQTNNWLTYFGGNSWDEFIACKFDGSGALFIVGFSNSTNKSPVGASGTYTQTYGASQLSSGLDAIILKLNASTSALDWFTYYGGTSVNSSFAFPDDQFLGLDIDGSNVYACGLTGATNLPSSMNSKFQSTYYDGMIAKFTTGGVFAASKYTHGNAINHAVKVFNNKVYTCGLAHFGMNLINSGNYYYYTICTLTDDNANFAVHNKNLDTTFHNTYFGDNGYDEASDIQYDPNTNVFYISGATMAPFYPTNSVGGMFNSSYTGTGMNYFVTSFRENDVNMLWSTCIGSGGVETDGNGRCASISINGQGYLDLCGVTNSYTFFPLADDNGVPYFQAFSASNPPPNNTTFNGTITRFDLSSFNVWVGINDFPNTSFSYGLYPNPTSKFLTIENKELINQNLRYAIYDLQGKKLNEGNLNTNNQKTIDVSALQSGVYLINVSNGTRTFSNKFVKTEN